MPRVTSLLVVLLMAVPSFADNLTYMRIDKSVLEQRVQTPPATEQARLQVLRSQFQSAGCTGDQLQEEPVTEPAPPNLICTLPGTYPGTIVIGARLDFIAQGDEGAVQWATVAMLPLLAESLNAAPHRHTFVFAAFAGHEHGFAGATRFLNQLSETQRTSIVAMIDLDHLGRVPPSYGAPVPGLSRMPTGGRRAVVNQTSQDQTPLSEVLPMAARALKYSDEPQVSNDIPATDARVFHDAGVMAIVIHSHAYAVMNQIRNNPAHFARTELDPQVYSDTYNLMCVFVLFADKALGTRGSKRSNTEVMQAGAPAPQTEPGSGNPGAPSPVNSSSATAQPVAGVAPSTPVESLGGQTRAATPSAASNATPTFRATTRLVQVDVVVTDKSGRPIEDLQQQDFTILQDGKPQKLRAFEAHAPATRIDNPNPSQPVAPTPQRPALPPNVYSNLPNESPDQSWTIILYDMLNTPTRDQQTARKQLVSLLKSVPAGKPVALFVLTQYLQMLQAFTQDPNALLSSAQVLIPSNSQLLTTEAQRQEEQGTADYASREVNANAVVGSDTSIAAGGIQQQLKDLEAFRTEQRILFTLDALNGLARAVSGYPGRKNLIWLSGAFPIRLEPDLAATEGNEFRNQRDYLAALRNTGSLLAESRIAVYPIDIRGLQNRGLDISTSTLASGTFTDTRDAVGSHGLQATSGSGAGDLLNQQASAYSDERSTMLGIAEQTGGRAFLNTNDFRTAMARSIDDGSTFYTLAFTPGKHDEKAAYHRIEIKLDRPDVRLSYRRGYYSEPRQTSVEAGTAALRGALQPGMPPATMLFVTAVIHPPDGKNPKVRIDYVVNPNNVTFAEEPGNKKRVVLDCMAIAYDKEGKEAGHASDTLDGAIPVSAYDAVLAHGLPAQQEISLPPGNYTLRLGVMDRPTQQIGTVTVPLVIGHTASPLN